MTLQASRIGVYIVIMHVMACHLTPFYKILTAVAPILSAEQCDVAASGYVQDGKTIMSNDHVGLHVAKPIHCTSAKRPTPGA